MIGQELLAVFSYSAFIIARCVELRYILASKKEKADKLRLHRMDFVSYRMIAFGFLMLTVTILTGSLWAEQFRSYCLHLQV